MADPKVKVIEVFFDAALPAQLEAELKALAKRFGAVEALSKRTAKGWQFGAAFSDFAQADQFHQLMEAISTGRVRAAGAVAGN